MVIRDAVILSHWKKKGLRTMANGGEGDHSAITNGDANTRKSHPGYEETRTKRRKFAGSTEKMRLKCITTRFPGAER